MIKAIQKFFKMINDEGFGIETIASEHLHAAYRAQDAHILKLRRKPA